MTSWQIPEHVLKIRPLTKVLHVLPNWLSKVTSKLDMHTATVAHVKAVNVYREKRATAPLIPKFGTRWRRMVPLNKTMNENTRQHWQPCEKEYQYTHTHIYIYIYIYILYYCAVCRYKSIVLLRCVQVLMCCTTSLCAGTNVLYYCVVCRYKCTVLLHCVQVKMYCTAALCAGTNVLYYCVVCRYKCTVLMHCVQV